MSPFGTSLPFLDVRSMSAIEGNADIQAKDAEWQKSTHSGRSKAVPLDVQFRVADYARQSELRRHHGRRQLAAEPWPGAI